MVVINDNPITYDEMKGLIEPLYQIIGAGVAVIVIIFAIWVVVWPFLNRRVR